MRRIITWLVALLTSACYHPHYFGHSEQALGTDGHFESLAHIAVYYPSEIALAGPGYVVGLELVDRDTHLLPNDLVVVGLKGTGRTTARLIDELREGSPRPDAVTRPIWGGGQVPIVSQVLRYGGQRLSEQNCAIYSLYQSAAPELMDFCDGRRVPDIGSPPRYESAFAASWEAIDVLGKALRNDVATGQYTHVIVAMMGWRTTQEEAIRNFNSLLRTVRLAGGDEFRPLFIGITWVATWSGRWADPLVESFAYPEIAELADTLGLTWLGVLTNEAILPLSATLPVSFITHSFGSRAALTAVCIGPAIRRSPGAPASTPAGSIDRLIGFQAAFSLQRLKDEPLSWIYEDVRLPNRCARARSIVLTTSKHDSAARTIIWADLAGNYRYYKSFCRQNAGTLVSCASLDEHGAIEGSYDDTLKVVYLDATKLIRFKAPGTNGGAHSDIFRLPVGRLIWTFIAPRPPATGSPGAPNPASK